MNTRDKISKAIIKLFSYPFFGSFITNFELIEKKEVVTMATNDKFEIFYNPEFVEQLSNNELVAALMHELGHFLFRHHQRRGIRDHLVWNIAGDIVINYQLQKDKIELPRQGILVDVYDASVKFAKIEIKDIDKKSTEDIYNELISNSNIQEISKQFKEIHGQCVDFREFESEEAKREFENKLKRAIIKAKIDAEKKNQWGNLTEGIRRIIEEWVETKINWKTLLSRYVQQLIPIDLTFSKPNKKFIQFGYYLPSLKKENIEIVIAIDTSGSIDNDLINEFFSNLKAVLSSFQNISVHYLCFDAKVQAYQQLKSINDLKKIDVSGGGGTNIQSAFDFVKKKKIKPGVFIIFTDGYGDFENEYNFKTIWVMPKQDYNKKLKIKGQIILIE